MSVYVYSVSVKVQEQYTVSVPGCPSAFEMDGLIGLKLEQVVHLSLPPSHHWYTVN